MSAVAQGCKQVLYMKGVKVFAVKSMVCCKSLGGINNM